METLETIREKIEDVLAVDRETLRRQWRKLRSHGDRLDNATFQQHFRRLEVSLQRAAVRREQREASIPTITFDGDLPIHRHRDEIQQALLGRQTLVVAGETGSGKSTQLPKICLDAGLGRAGIIGHTQPRRIAARSIASRLAEELGVSLGRQIGYKIRFQDKTDHNTLVKLMTDGILLAETQSDRYLEQYEVIILDEAHERSLNIDFLLGYLKQILVRRSDLHLIITSATIDARRFSEHFADAHGAAPIVEVSGRGYPVEIRYRPSTGEGPRDADWTDAVIDGVHEVAGIDRGDVLVFLPTERDIREMARRLRGEMFPGDGSRTTEILPLYARLSAAEQNRIFRHSDYRRIILATNVAESSLTVPNVRYVVDTGTARISRYSPRSKILRLPIEPVSQASANQRAGRCGRVAPGVCIRLYDEDDFSQRDAYTTPEVRRTNLASVILQAKALHLGPIEQFPFLDPPRLESVRDGYKTLFEIQAIDAVRELTELGKRLARMPVDPRMGRMILAAADENCLSEILVIAAALELQDPRERPHDKQQHADQRHERFLDPQSDFLSYLKIWDFYHHLKETVSRSQLRRACRENFLSFNRLREWTEIHRQLLQVVAQQRLRAGPRRDDYASIHRALLAGLLSGVAYRSADFEYTGAGGIKLSLWPGSGLRRQRHDWVIAAERLETSRRYARTVARISPTWIEPLADHLVKRSYSDPHWHRKSGTVMAFEKVSLMGMPVVARRRARYGKIDPAASRQIFIQGALVERRTDEFDSFMKANHELRQEIDDLAARTRQRQYVLDDYSYFAFYDDHVPADIFDIAGLRRWLNADAAHRRRLTMVMDDLVQVAEPENAQDDFPSELEVGNLRLPARYHFQPGTEDDGVTVQVPAEAVHQLNSDQTEWLVPGLLEEKVIALIRSLPKTLRRNFVPVPDTAKEIVATLPYGEGAFLPTLATELSRIADEVVKPSDFRQDKLPDHLRLNIEVVDDEGAAVERGRDLATLRRAVRGAGGEQDDALTVSDERWHRDGLVTWDFESLPQEVSIQRGGIQIAAHPALIDRGDSVDLRLLSSLDDADRATRRGLSRLYTLAMRKSLRSQIRWLPHWNEIGVWASSAIDSETLKNDVVLRISELAFVGRDAAVRDEQEYKTRLDSGVERIGIATQELAPVLYRLFEAYHAARIALEDIQAARYATALADIDGQLKVLIQPDFLVDVPWAWMQQYPRIFRALVYRIDKLRSGGQQRDDEGMRVVEPFWQRCVEQLAHNEQQRRYDPALVEYRWMVEELRVSLFAQPLGTSMKISPKRMDNQWSKVSAE